MPAQFAGALTPCLVPIRGTPEAPATTSISTQTQAEPQGRWRGHCIFDWKDRGELPYLIPWMHAICRLLYLSLRYLGYSSALAPSLRVRPSILLLNEVVGFEITTFALHPAWGIVLTVFHFVAMMSLARLRVIIRKIPMKLFIVTTVMMLARMLFTNILNFLLIRILREKFLSCLCTKNRFTAHVQLICFFISWTLSSTREKAIVLAFGC